MINVPKAEPKPSAKDLAPVKVSPVAAGEPMPLPDIARLAYYETASLDTADLESKARLIEQTLGSFKVEARVREINPGPAVTQFTLEPARADRLACLATTKRTARAVRTGSQGFGMTAPCDVKAGRAH